MILLANLNTGIALWSRGDTLNLGNDLSFGVGLAGHQFGVVITLGVDNLELTWVRGRVGLLDRSSICDLLDFSVRGGHLACLRVYVDWSMEEIALAASVFLNGKGYLGEE